jgi:hypothetical protein
MNNVPVDMFHLVRAKFALKKALAFCGLVSILLTASCGPTPDGSKELSLPEIEDTELGDTGETLQIQPEVIPLTKPQVKVEPTPKPEIKPEPPIVKTKKIPTPDADPVPSTKAPAPSTSTGSQGDGNAGTAAATTTAIDKASDEEIRATIARLSVNHLWAMMPTYVDSYKDLTGQVHEHFKVSSGDSPELKELLAKMRNDLVENPDERLKLEIKEQGVCENEEGKKAVSTIKCDTKAPICLSLEEIKATIPKADIEQALKPLIMREFANQHCADAAMTKQVEQYYNLPAIKYFRFTTSVASLFNRVRTSLVYLQSQLTSGMTPNAGSYAQKIDSKEEICGMIKQGSAQAQALQDKIVLSGFVKDPKSPVKAPRLALTETLQGMSSSCEGNSLDRASLLPSLEQAIKLYDYLAQEFSNNSGMIVMDFSKHLWPHGNADGTGK